MAALKNCSACKHSHVDPDTRTRQCRRNPPGTSALLVPVPETPRTLGGGLGLQVIAAWPSVKDTDHCGEFGQRIATVLPH